MSRKLKHFNELYLDVLNTLNPQIFERTTSLFFLSTRSLTVHVSNIEFRLSGNQHYMWSFKRTTEPKEVQQLSVTFFTVHVICQLAAKLLRMGGASSPRYSEHCFIIRPGIKWAFRTVGSVDFSALSLGPPTLSCPWFNTLCRATVSWKQSCVHQSGRKAKMWSFGREQPLPV
jgi:hypothetical protein